MSFKRPLIAILSLLSFSAAFTSQVHAGAYKPLFNGKDLSGWHTKPGGKWEAKDGMIVGSSPKSEKRHGLLVTDRKYANFTIKLKFKLVKGNSGFYFRSEEVKSKVGVHGIQAEVAHAFAGGLYETGGRKWIAKPDQKVIDKHFRKDGWNDLTVIANKGDITVTFNGITTAQLQNDPGRKEGHFALQLHGNQDMLIMFKDIQIMVLD